MWGTPAGGGPGQPEGVPERTDGIPEGRARQGTLEGEAELS